MLTPMFCVKKISHTGSTYLVTKFQLVRSEHNDIVINRQDGLRLNLVVRVETIAQLVLFGLDYLQWFVDLWPLINWNLQTKIK